MSEIALLVNSEMEIFPVPFSYKNYLWDLSVNGIKIYMVISM